VKRSTLQRKTPLTASPLTREQFKQRGKKSAAKAMSKRGPISPASRAQRAKTRLMGLCVGCGALATDSMHLWPRSLGGCDDEACTLPGCRSCHTSFDAGELDLSGVLALPEFVAERMHMASHAPFDRCMRRLRGRLAADGDPLALAVVKDDQEVER
jgi:hypothetical protein